MAFFIVKFGSPSVNSNDWLVATDDDGRELRWGNGGEAAAHAKALNEGFRERGEELRASVKREADTATDVDWKARARERFASGHWETVPWDGAWWSASGGSPHAPDGAHFVHVAKGDATKVAFYASPEDGAADRLTVMLPGRYLSRFFGPNGLFPAISDSAIGDFAAEMGADANDTILHFVSTPEEFERVYTNGPSSCMAYSSCDYDSECHPVRVYAAGDLHLAYLTREGNIIARALCWPERKIYARVYGDDIRLSRKLKAQGFTRGSLEGARMLRIEQDGSFVAPYIDCCGRARDDGEFLIIDSDGPLMCGNTNGLCEAPFTCPHCGECCDRDDVIYIAGETREYWCASCAEDDAYYCNDCGNYFANDDRTPHTVQVQRGWGWGSSARNMREYEQIVCDRCVEDYVHVPNRDAYYAADRTFQCEQCGEHFLTEDEHAAHPDTCSTCGEALDDPHAPAPSFDPHPDQVSLPLTA